MKKSLFILMLGVLAVGCSDNDGRSEITPGDTYSMDLDFSSHKLALKKADSCDEYRSHILDAVARDIVNSRFGLFYYYRDDIDYAEDSELPTASDDSNQPAGEFTATNNQENGVDEVDDVKNDGTWMYSALRQNGSVNIMKAWPAEEAKFAAQIPSESIENTYLHNNGILLDGNQLIVIDTLHRHNDGHYYWYNYGDESTRVRIYDVTDPTHPRLTKTHEMEGSFVQGRMINHRIHLVLSAQTNKILNGFDTLYQKDIPGLPKYDENIWMEDYSLEKREKYINKYLPFVRGWLEKQYPTADFLNWPQYTDSKSQRDLVSCTDLYIPGTTSSDFGMLMMTEISGTNFENVKAQAIADSGWTVYASKDNMYVVSTSADWSWDCYEKSDCRSYSHIHRFALGKDDGEARYANSGEVTGIVSDQFWMSEHNGYLRVASDENYAWFDRASGSRLSILKLDGPQMDVVSTIGDIGNREHLYAARMFGDKGYMVTFRQTDPLFTFDLSDPMNPIKKGELKINGYSSYIHAMDANHLLTIGEDAEDNGKVTGLHLQVFDVSDLSNPTRTHHLRFDRTDTSYTWSQALYAHHAFTYHAGSGLLSLPISQDTWSNVEPYTTTYWSGAHVYRVSADKGFEGLGKVDHSAFMENGYPGTVSRSRFYFAKEGTYSEGAYIYTLSEQGMKVNDANEPAKEFASIAYPKN